MYYSPLENVKILVGMLKAYGIKHIVLSPGNRNIPLVYMVEQEDYFTCYSIVDERSAAFFAVGLMEKLQCPVAICCTSGTAICNYSSGVAEAFYQRLPLVVLTADRNPYYLNQNEDQMVPQRNLLEPVCKCSVQLPFVREKRDYWFCKNQIHKALLELSHGERGPVHINFPIEDGIGDCSDGFREKIPVFSPISRYELRNQNTWERCFKELCSSKIMIVFGQNTMCQVEELAALNQFAMKYNCVIAADHLSNFHGNKCLNLFTACETMSRVEFDELCPDILITVHGNFVFSLKEKIISRNKNVKHWLVDNSGEVRDAFRCLDAIFEVFPTEFFSYFSEKDVEGADSYYQEWKKITDRIHIPQLEYSSIYVVGELLKNMPDNSMLHIANSSSVRLANNFPLKENIEVFCNRGTNGIDGSFSSFMGNAAVSNSLSFLLIGDLSLFYDLNAVWNRYIGNNIRVLLNHNGGAEIFYYGYGSKLSGIDKHIAAAHNTTAKGWLETQGFEYLCAHDKKEFQESLQQFLNPKSKHPIFFEVFTSKEDDAKILHKFYEDNTPFEIKRATKGIVKKVMEKNKMMEKVIRTGKNMVEQSSNKGK